MNRACRLTGMRGRQGWLAAATCKYQTSTGCTNQMDAICHVRERPIVQLPHVLYMEQAQHRAFQGIRQLWSLRMLSFHTFFPPRNKLWRIQERTRNSSMSVKCREAVQSTVRALDEDNSERGQRLIALVVLGSRWLWRRATGAGASHTCHIGT